MTACTQGVTQIREDREKNAREKADAWGKRMVRRSARRGSGRARACYSKGAHRRKCGTRLRTRLRSAARGRASRTASSLT